MELTSTTDAAAAAGSGPRQLVPGAIVAAVGGPALLALTNALVAWFPGYADVESTADVVRVLGEEPLLTEVVVLVGLGGAALLFPAIWAVAAVLAPRTPHLAAVGGWLMATGYVMSVVLSTDTATALAVATTGADPATYVEAIDQHLPLSMTLLYGVFGVGALVGGLVLGIAMLRQRGAVPAWAGWALVASEPVRVAGLLLGVQVGPPLASLLILVAFVATIRSARRTGDA